MTEEELSESRLRSIFKAVTYRITGTVTTAAIVWGVTGEAAVALAVGGAEPIVKLVVYYVHERAWQRVPRGTVRRSFGLVRRRAQPPPGA